ncbi:uncharacterized protein TNCV_1108581 [Trichonephila clavipes]|nr:uncharacterized protein TNCV_1108581 [Trichonephila clavipes]
MTTAHALEDAHTDGSPEESIFAGERVTCLLVGHHCHKSVIEIVTAHASPDRPPLLFRILRIESQLRPQSGIAGGIIGPYFFKNDEGHNVTVNGDRYRAMITNFFIPELNNQDVQELWFQQDGATCHTARATIDLLKDTFDDRLI